MSEPISESIPTSADPRSHRPLKRARGSNYNSALTTQATAVNHLFLDPSKPVELPPSASKAKSKNSAAAPPEIVANVQGSSAGAGSGEFHVYKASRRREYERLRVMDEEAREEEEQEVWAKEAEERKKADEERTRKKREKRNKMKGKVKGGDTISGDGKSEKDGQGDGAKKPLQVPHKEGPCDQNGNGEKSACVGEVFEETGITIHEDD